VSAPVMEATPPRLLMVCLLADPPRVMADLEDPEVACSGYARSVISLAPTTQQDGEWSRSTAASRWPALLVDGLSPLASLSMGLGLIARSPRAKPRWPAGGRTSISPCAASEGRAAAHQGIRISPKTISTAKLTRLDRSTDLSRNSPAILVTPMTR
jgi:hypothetical protein